MTTASPSPALGTLQPLDTCPKLPDVPYVLMVGYVPVVASYVDDLWEVPGWNLWLGDFPYASAIPEDDIQGWFLIEIPD
jgi:hypothetical protein